MKYVVCIPDGCADEPFAGLAGKTPLEVANMPVLASLLTTATVGSARVIPSGMAPGSDVGNLSIFGYDPAGSHTGRAPIEAAALGLRLSADEIAFRCNLVTVEGDTSDGVGMVDFAGGHPNDSDAARAIDALNAAALHPDVRFHSGVQYRHIMVAPRSWLGVECAPPHDHTGSIAPWPRGEGEAEGSSDVLRQIMLDSRAVLESVDRVVANQVWLWGQGPMPTLERFSDRFGVSAALVTAVDLVRGLGVLADVEVLDVPGATGWYDTDYEGKRDAALDALRAGADLVFIHVEATDEAGHAQNANEKVRALENWDSRILAELVPALDEMGPWRLLMVPDHATPLGLRTHTETPVPYVLYDRHAPGPGGIYSEQAVDRLDPVAGHELIRTLIEGW